VADGRRRDELSARELLLRTAPRDRDRGDAISLPPDALDRRAHRDLGAALADEIPAPLPHLTRTQTRIAKPVDQRLGDLAAALAEKSVADRAAERQVSDALRCPVRRELLRRDPPHFFGVGLEEDFEETLAKAVGDPLLEVIFDRIRIELRQEKA